MNNDQTNEPGHPVEKDSILFFTLPRPRGEFKQVQTWNGTKCLRCDSPRRRCMSNAICFTANVLKVA